MRLRVQHLRRAGQRRIAGDAVPAPAAPGSSAHAAESGVTCSVSVRVVVLGAVVPEEHAHRGGDAAGEGAHEIRQSRGRGDLRAGEMPAMMIWFSGRKNSDRPKPMMKRGSRQLAE